MRSVIKLDVPDYQIGQPVTVYFKDTMQKIGICEEEKRPILCKDCIHFREHRMIVDFGKPDEIDYYCYHPNDGMNSHSRTRGPEWYCADAEK